MNTKEKQPSNQRSGIITEQELRHLFDQVLSQAASRTFTRASSSAAETNNDDDEEYLKCPTCKIKYGLIIYECPNGHSSCKDCRERCANCGVCGSRITNTRNMTLESYIAQVKVPCPNASDGCRYIVKNEDIDSHLKGCLHHVINCPLRSLTGCSWSGKISKIVVHFDQKHPQHRLDLKRSETYLNNINYVNDIQLIIIAYFNFLLHIVSKNGKLHMAVRLLGTPAAASNWTYTVHIFDKENPIRKFEYKNVCLSHATPIDDIIEVPNCLQITSELAMTYFNKGRLTYKLSIKKNGGSSDQQGTN